MSVTLTFSILGQRLATVNLNLESDQPHEVDAVVNKSIKWFSRNWTRRMTA